MDIEKYRQIITDLLEEYSQYKPANGEVDLEVIIDKEHDRYTLMQIGWQGAKRIHGSIIHIDIIDGKVWLQYDGTSATIAEELVERGIPREKIVLGFRPPNLRQLSGFAIL